MNVKELEAILSEVTIAEVEKKQLIKKWIRPNSTAIAKYGYNNEAQLLGICYHSEPETEYIYQDVPFHLFESLLASRSKGRFIAEVFTHKKWAHIKQ